MKRRVILFLDWLDDRIIDHRWYWLCEFIAMNYPEDEIDEMIEEEE